MSFLWIMNEFRVAFNSFLPLMVALMGNHINRMLRQAEENLGLVYS